MKSCVWIVTFLGVLAATVSQAAPPPATSPAPVSTTTGPTTFPTTLPAINLVHKSAVDATVNGAKVTADALRDNQWVQYAPVLGSELAKYPKALLASAKLKNVVVVRNLKVNGQEAEIYPAASAETLYIDGMALGWDRRLQRRQVARGVFEMLKLPAWKDEEWIRHNPPGFQYAPLRLGKQPTSIFGFFDDDSRANMGDDVSRFFAYLMTDISRVELRSQRDPYIRGKCQTMEEAMHATFPEMGREYWARLAQQQEVLAEVDRSAVMKDPAGYVERQLVNLAAEYGIEILWDKVPFFVPNFGLPPDPNLLNQYGPLFIRELGRYPSDVLKRMEVKRLVLVGQFAEKGLLGAANQETRTIFYLCTPQGRSEEAMRETIHHELLHQLDYTDDGTVNDPEWEKLNPPDFRYAYAGENSGLTDAVPGFVSGYAMYAVQEDKAETFGAMMTRLTQLEQRATKDKVLAAKIERMKQLTARFSPNMGEKYWEAARSASAILTQRYPPGRYLVKLSADREESGTTIGLVRGWGETELDMLVDPRNEDGKQRIVLRIRHQRQNVRIAARTHTYATEMEDKYSELAKLFKWFDGALFVTAVDEKCRVDTIKGFDNVVAQAKEEAGALAADAVEGLRDSQENGIRYIALPYVTPMLPEGALRRGDSWKGTALFAYRLLTESVMPMDLYLPRIEGEIAVVQFKGGTVKTIKIKGDEKKLAVIHEGEFGIHMKTGMVMWIKSTFTSGLENERTVTTFSMRVTPVED